MRTIKDILYERMIEEQEITKPIIELIHIKYNKIIEDLQKTCTHKWENGESSIIHMIDDDCEGYNSEPTWDEWDLCDICDMVMNYTKFKDIE